MTSRIKNTAFNTRVNRWVFDTQEDLMRIHTRRVLTEADLYNTAISKADGSIYILTGVPGTGGVTWSELNVKEGKRGAVGPRGESGDRGERGDMGFIGYQGDLGPIGEEGHRGDVGAIGDQGMAGGPGMPGMPGELGASGPMGAKGDEGDVGEAGRPGYRGNAGDRGERGLFGVVGLPGPNGEVGVTGDRGATGECGLKGEEGDQGLKGQPGRIGRTGDKGPQGEQGQSGIAGIEGPMGPQGAAGPQGPRAYIHHDITRVLESASSALIDVSNDGYVTYDTSKSITVSEVISPSHMRGCHDVKVGLKGAFFITGSTNINLVDTASSGYSLISSADDLLMERFGTNVSDVRVDRVSSVTLSLRDEATFINVSCATDTVITSPKGRQSVDISKDAMIDYWALEGSHFAYKDKRVSLGTVDNKGKVLGRLEAQGTGMGIEVSVSGRYSIGTALTFTEFGWTPSIYEDDIDAIITSELAVSTPESRVDNLSKLCTIGRVSFLVKETVSVGQYLNLNGKVSSKPTPLLALEPCELTLGQEKMIWCFFNKSLIH